MVIYETKIETVHKLAVQLSYTRSIKTFHKKNYEKITSDILNDSIK